LPDRRVLTRQEPQTEPKDKDLAMIERDKDQATIQALQKRVRERERSLTERDRQIEIMSSQLNAMKRIDQDARDRRLPKRPASMTAPPSPPAVPSQ
jgi:DNA gyrase/topoisomerase IV subunit A